MDAVLYEAVGTFGQGRLQLLQEAVRIVRGNEVKTIPFREIGAVRLVPSSALHSGSLSFQPQGGVATDDAEAGRTIHFNGRQQKHFEEIARRVEARMSGETSERPDEVATPVESEQSRGPLLSRLLSTPAAGHGDVTAEHVEASEHESVAPEPLSPRTGLGSRWATADADSAKQPDAEYPLTAERLMTRLVSVAGRVGLAARGESNEEIALAPVLSFTSEVNGALRSRVDGYAGSSSEAGGGFEHLGAEYLVAAMSLATREAVTAHDHALRAAKGGGRSLFGGRSSDPWVPVNRCMDAATSAICLLCVLDAYVEPDSEDHAAVRDSLMYEALTTGLAAVSRQLYPVVHDPRSSTPLSVEPFFANATETMKGLRGIIADRREDLQSLSPSRRIGTAFMLDRAVDAWERSVNSLGDARQLYLAAREWWPGQASLVVEAIAKTMGHLLVGQSLVVCADAYASQSGMPETVQLSASA